MSDCLQPMDYSPPGSTVHGILQTRMLEWVAMPSPEIFPTQGLNSCLHHRWILYSWATGNTHIHICISTYSWVNINVLRFILVCKLHTHIWCKCNSLTLILCLCWFLQFVSSNSLCIPSSYLFFKNQFKIHTSNVMQLCWISPKNVFSVCFHYFIYQSLLLDNELF